jgi:hypothetical protein
LLNWLGVGETMRGLPIKITEKKPSVEEGSDSEDPEDLKLHRPRKLSGAVRGLPVEIIGEMSPDERDLHRMGNVGSPFVLRSDRPDFLLSRLDLGETMRGLPIKIAGKKPNVEGGSDSEDPESSCARVRKPRRPCNKWLPEEDQVLKELYAKLKPNWGEISRRMRKMGYNRNRKQCRNRWEEKLNPAINYGRWLPKEDRLLQRLHGQYGPQWERIAVAMPNREGKRRAGWQCRRRMKMLLRRVKNKTLRVRCVRCRVTHPM